MSSRFQRASEPGQSTQIWDSIWAQKRPNEPFLRLSYRKSRFGAPDVFLQTELEPSAKSARLSVRSDNVVHFVVDDSLANYGHMLDVAQPMVLRKTEVGERPKTYNTGLLNRTWKICVVDVYTMRCFVLEDAFNLRAKRYLGYKDDGWFLADKTSACIFSAELPATTSVIQAN